MSNKQQRRADVLSKLDGGRMSIGQACTLLGWSVRHVRRMLTRYRKEGVRCVVHGNTGRAPVNRTPEHVRRQVKDLAGPEGEYHDFNTCHLQEVLLEKHHLQIGRSTLDRLLIAEGVRRRRRSRRRHTFRWRQRCPQEGDMLLIDGSPYDWLEGRNPEHKRLCLLGCMDDATGKVLHLRFWPTECLDGYITMLRDVVLRYGIPARFYHDRHTILASPKETTIEDELADRKPMSQFESVLDDLGVESIKALTPQAKGRIERLWRTLQDRLVKELRLARICSPEEANQFLGGFTQRFNTQFAVPAQDPETAFYPVADLDPAYFFAVREERTVRPDNTISFKGTCFQLQPQNGRRSLAGKRVRVHTTPEGEHFVYVGRERVPHVVLPTQPARTGNGQRQAIPAASNTASPRPPKPSDRPGTRAWLFGKR